MPTTAPDMRRPFIVSADPATPDDNGLVSLSDFGGKAYTGTISTLKPDSGTYDDIRIGLLRIMREAFVNGFAGICDVKVTRYG